MRAIQKGFTRMREIKVRRNELLETVKQNRITHIEDYKNSVEGYKEAAIKEIDNAVKKLKKQINDLKEGEMIKLASIMFSLPVPENHEKDYNQVIKMLEMSVDDELSIKSDEFACYVMDDWDWKDAWTNVASNYNVKFRN